MRDRHHVSGIREPLPAGETLLWEGRPDRRRLIAHVFGIRALALYFVALSVLAVVSSWGDGSLVARLVWLGVLAAVLHSMLVGLALWIERSTSYAITDRRVIIRKGLALPSVLNLPFQRVKNLTWAQYGDGSGDIAIEMAGGHVRYLLLWPHARPWHFRSPQPAFRAVEEVTEVADTLRTAWEGFVASGGEVVEQTGGAEIRIMDEDDTVLIGSRVPKELAE